MKNEKTTYPEGYFVNKWMGIGMVIFAGLGVPLSIATGNEGLIGIGPAMGMSVGIAIGASLEEKYKKQGLIVPDSEKGSRKRKAAIAITIIGIAIAAAIVLAV